MTWRARVITCTVQLGGECLKYIPTLEENDVFSQGACGNQVILLNSLPIYFAPWGFQNLPGHSADIILVLKSQTGFNLGEEHRSACANQTIRGARLLMARNSFLGKQLFWMKSAWC